MAGKTPKSMVAGEHLLSIENENEDLDDLAARRRPSDTKEDDEAGVLEMKDTEKRRSVTRNKTECIKSNGLTKSNSDFQSTDAKDKKEHD